MRTHLPLAVTAALLAAAASTAAAPRAPHPRPTPTQCHVDQRYRGGYADLLVCGADRLRDISVQATGSQITGVSWRQHDGGKRERSIILDHTGQVFFLVSDDAIRGGFYAKSRAVWRHVFPRRHPIRIERSDDGLHLHDPAGNVWTLTATPRGRGRTSWAVTAINGKAQPVVKMDHSERGIIGADLRALTSLVLQRQEGSHHGLQNRRSRAYHRTRSVFVDAQGSRCAVANGELFGPNPNDPDDKYDNVFRFDEDAPVRELLARRCPKLDLRGLGDAAVTLAQ